MPRIAIDAQLLPDGFAGGVEQFVLGLVHSLGRLQDGPEEYLIITPPERPDWITPYLGANERVVPGPRRPRREVLWETAKRVVRPAWRRLRPCIRPRATPSAKAVSVPRSGGFYESLGADLLHFPYQNLVLTQLPFIFDPHDLQHLHYPQFFTPDQLARRAAIYAAGCRLARAVAVPSVSVKDDVVRQYSVDAGNVYVITRGSPTELYGDVVPRDLAVTKKRFRLPETFALFPAQTWPHKNHIRLLEAIALLRDRHDLSLKLVCTGRRNDFWRGIQSSIDRLRLENTVTFTDFVTPKELRALYRLATFVVLPSLFEGGGFPVIEALHEGTPIACSAVTSLPEYAGDAALLFDPTSVESIADACLRMVRDDRLRALLRRQGMQRARCFEWKQVASTYRALYRKALGIPLVHSEVELLSSAERAMRRAVPLDVLDQVHSRAQGSTTS